MQAKDRGAVWHFQPAGTEQEDSLKKGEGTVTEVAIEREIGRLEVDL